jgi:hypothetical protein
MAHVTFIHGIGNKPELSALLGIWRRRLAQGSGGLALGDLNVESTMIYWADVLYESPDPNVGAFERAEGRDLIEAAAEPDEPAAPPAPTIEESTFVAGLAAKVGGTLAAAESVAAIAPDRDAEAGELGYERVPLPWALKRRFLEHFLRDVHHYLFNVESHPRPGARFRVQDEIRQRFVAQLRADAANGRPHIVVSHSMGTVIAYDCLKRVAGCPAVDGLITLGSPLGLDEIQDKLQPGWTRPDGFPGEKLAGAWVNVFDRLDPVDGFDPFLANDFRSGDAARVQDVEVVNEGSWRHAIVQYLQRRELRRALGGMLQLPGS